MSSKLADVSQIYHQNPQLKKQDVNTIFEWLQSQPHLPKITELQVILFLHSCYYKTEATKTTIETYFTLRASSDFFRSGDEDLIRRTLPTFFTDILPKKTPEGYCIWSFRLMEPKLANNNYVEFIKITIMVVTLHFYLHGPANGLLILADMTNFSFSHIVRMPPTAIKTILQFLEKAVPTRVKAIHFVNVGSVTKTLVSFVKPFMKKELFNMIQLHSHFESLYKFIPKECLVEEYGGHLGPVRNLHEQVLLKVLENLDLFQWHDAQQIDESKRVNKKNAGFFNNIFRS